ncbi:uncharacterized protein LOC142488373 [Ascaphus truei]|uniref:uncharacterized protein LOC142488373 n=1 Tax=Ascaphus truei TaxID=8439 RepID=UPI003F5942E5
MDRGKFSPRTGRGALSSMIIDLRLLSYPVVILERLQSNPGKKDLSNGDLQGTRGGKTIQLQIKDWPNKEQEWTRDAAGYCLIPYGSEITKTNKNSRATRPNKWSRDAAGYCLIPYGSEITKANKSSRDKRESRESLGFQQNTSQMESLLLRSLEYGTKSNEKRQLLVHQKSDTDERSSAHTESGKHPTPRRTLKTQVRAREEQKLHLCTEKKQIISSIPLKNCIRSHRKKKLHVGMKITKGFLQDGNPPTHQKTQSKKNLIKGAKQNVFLKTHRIVKPFICTKCERRFCSNENLLKHQQTHTGRPFVCTNCGKCFSNKMILLVHQWIHTGGKPFGCTKFLAEDEPSGTPTNPHKR